LVISGSLQERFCLVVRSCILDAYLLYNQSKCILDVSDSLSSVVERDSMTTRFDRITIDPRLMNGQPCIRGMRLTVRRVLEIVALYPDRSELKQEYPELDDDDIRQALEFAADNLDDQIIALGGADPADAGLSDVVW